MAALRRGPSSRFIGPIALEARSRPAATAASGPAPAGASAIPSASRRLSVSCPATSSSRLSAKCRKKVLLVTPARSAICATVVASYPCSVNRSTAATTRRSRAPGSHRPMDSSYAMGLLSHHSVKVTGQGSHHLQESPMSFFVTGGTGLIGSAVVAELLGNGHTVLALARSDASARTAEAAGAEPLRGEIADLGVLQAGAARSDGVISLAFSRDYSNPDGLAQAIAQESAA